MNRCPVCNKILHEDAEFCPRCGWSSRAGCGLLLLSFLIPLFGIIYGFASMSHSPRKAKSCLIAAFAPIIFGIIVLAVALVVAIIVGSLAV